MKILKVELQNINSLKSDSPIIIDFQSEHFKNVGLYAITGSTGAGKTTIVNQLHQQLKIDQRKEVVLLRHRPGILPILSAFVHGKEKADQNAGCDDCQVRCSRPGKST